jgi:hypothetical protein
MVEQPPSRRSYRPSVKRGPVAKARAAGTASIDTSPPNAVIVTAPSFAVAVAVLSMNCTRQKAHEAQAQLCYFRQLPPRPARPLSGCCAGLHRR